jgi:predicted metal-dependent hydrolase
MTAMRAVSGTPEEVNILVRQRDHDLREVLATDWVDGNAYATAIFNAMSMTFPVGETSFVDSVRYFADKIDNPKLQEEMKGFYGQETVHRREHQKYNDILCEVRGYQFDQNDKKFSALNMDRYKLDIAQMDGHPKEQKLRVAHVGSTATAEHITAIFAERALSGWMLNNVDPRMKSLWHWHALEELEHKGVAFDVFRAAAGQYELSWRRKMGVFTAKMFYSDVTAVAHSMLEQDGKLGTLETRLQAAKFWWGRDGVLRHYTLPYLQFFKADFHPWQNDTREMAAKTIEAYPELAG